MILTAMLALTAVCAKADGVKAEGSGVDNSGQPRFLTLCDTAGGTVGAARISPDLVIKFSGDSILLQGVKAGGYPLEGLRSLRHTASAVTSPFKVSVCGDVAEAPPVEGATVMAVGEEIKEIGGVFAVTDSSGVAEFPKLPYGDYRITVANRDLRFRDLPSEMSVSHEFGDSVALALPENLVGLSDLNARVLPLDNGLNSLEVSWHLGIETPDNPFDDYEFLLYLNGEYKGTSSGRKCYVDGLEEGYYLLELCSRTGFGTPTGALSLDVSIERKPDTLLGIEDVEEDSGAEWQYYDLNGLRVDPTYLAPGIYIRSDGKLILISN